MRGPCEALSSMSQTFSSTHSASAGLDVLAGDLPDDDSRHGGAETIAYALDAQYRHAARRAKAVVNRLNGNGAFPPLQPAFGTRLSW